MNEFQAHIYFNIYLLRSVFFRCGVFEITQNQDKELKKIYKAPLLHKLNLGEKFLRKLLYARWNLIRVEIIQPNTAIAMNKMRLYLDNTRLNSNVEQMILALEDMVNT